MAFAGLRKEAIQTVKQDLRKPLGTDDVLVYAYRFTQQRPQALERWLFQLFPKKDPNDARDAVEKHGRDAWSEDGLGADMDREGWDALQTACSGKAPDLDVLAQHAAANLHALLGAQAAAEMIEAAGSLQSLVTMTQRDCMRLGDERGTFGGKPKKSILERHELSTNDRALRVLASRTILAARLDCYRGNFKGDSLRQEVLYAQ